MRPGRKLPLALLLLLQASACARCGRTPPRLDAIAPRVISNQTSYPVAISGDGFTAGMRLALGPPWSAEVETVLIDGRHLGARLPITAATGKAESATTARLLEASGEPADGQVSLVVIDDAGFPTPTGLVASGDGRLAFAVSPTTDEVWVWHRDGSAAERVQVGDGPRALALAGSSGAGEQLVVVHEFSPELRLLSAVDPQRPQRVIPIRAGALGVAVDRERGLAYVANHRSNSVQIVDLAAGAGRGELVAGVRPRSLALGAGLLAVANAGSGDVSIFDLAPSATSVAAPQRRLQPRPGTAIVGGHTERWAEYAVGGRQPRALAWDQARRLLFVASAGLNLGPNPDKIEVSTNGGIGVVDPATGTWRRHVSILAGVPQALALDGARGLLYAADLSRGLLTVLDAARLAGSDSEARRAVLASLPLPAGSAPRIRPAADLAVPRRAGTEIHAGPESLALADGGRTVLVLSRFDASVTEVDVSTWATPRVVRALPGPPMSAQRQRRLGEVVYFTDLGRSSMSCDACHPGGHDDGVFFAKTHPLRFYRSTTLRDVRETPPYFFPAGFPSLEVTASAVLGRNRFHNPDPSGEEIAALALYQRTIAALPNPYIDASGALPERLGLPDGRIGNPRLGLALFEGKAACKECHPAPQFTTDQDAATRGRSFDVGTPMTQPIHLEWQEAPPGPHQVPSLTGAWDEFPLLASGAGGFEVAPDGALVPTTRFPLRTVLEWKGGKPHGNAAALSERERDDLLAYLLTL